MRRVDAGSLPAWLLAHFAAALPAQTTHVVPSGGVNLQQAIHAAALGDILDLLPGDHNPATVSRGLRISLRSGARILAGGAPALTVLALPAGQAVVVEGGSVAGVSAIGCAGAVVCTDLEFYTSSPFTPARIDACSGPVVWTRLRGLSGGTFATGGLVLVENSAQVSFHASVIPATRITNSNVSFTDTTIPMQAAIEALRIESGRVAISGGRFTGGAVAWVTRWPGIQLDGGTLVLAGSAVVEATPILPVMPMSAIQSTGGTIRLDPAVTLNGTTPISGPATVTAAATPTLGVLRARHSATCQITAAAEPASLVFTLIALPHPVVPSVFGDLWLPPDSPILDVTVAPPGGAWTFARSLAAAPPFLALVVQSAALTTAGSIVVGNPARFLWD